MYFLIVIVFMIGFLKAYWEAITEMYESTGCLGALATVIFYPIIVMVCFVWLIQFVLWLVQVIFG